MTAVAELDSAHQMFQPIVGRRTVSWVEVLAPDPTALGNLTPGDLRRHDLNMLATAAQRALNWQPDYPGLGITVNAPPTHFKVPTYAEDIVGIIGAVGLPPKLVLVEITEETKLDLDHPVVEQNLRLLSAAGIGLALDDFDGTVHAWKTLMRLRDHQDISLAAVKLSMELVRNLDTEAGWNELQGLLPLMDAGIMLVAEGVSEGFRKLCRALQDAGLQVQGWFYTPKLPHGELLDWLAENRRS